MFTMQSNLKIRLSIVTGLIIAITVAHYSTDVSVHNMHHVYRRLYYIPIILTSFWFGLRGGIYCSLSISAIYIPHVLFQHHAAFFAQLNIYLEIVLFNVIGLITGILSSAQMKENTRKIELERHLERAARLSELGEMAAGIAHEIRNPLYSIKGTAEIISEEFKPTDKKYDMSRIMINEIDRLNDLVNNFLQFAKPKEPTFIDADLNDLIRKSLEIVKFRYSNQFNKIELAQNGNISTCFIDSEQIKQVLINIIFNSLEEIDPSSGRIKVNIREQKDDVIIDVIDNGPGISDDKLEKIFTPFFSTKDNGTGLGLSISEKLIEANNGRISVANNKDHGCTFSLHLPKIKQS